MLAVVIPFYKIEFFRECLESLANQTNKGFKVYIGDDASPHNPTALIEEFGDSLEITYERFQRNLGKYSLVEQWSRCISMAENEDWVMVLGDDDFLEPDLVQQWYENYPKFGEKTNIIRFATVTVDSSGNPLSKKYVHPEWETSTDSYFRRFIQQTRSSLSEYVFRRTSYAKHGFYDFPLGWYSDNRAWLEFAGSKPIYSINDSTVYIRMSELNISGKADNLNTKMKAQLEFYEYLINEKLELFTRNQRIRLLRYYEDRLKDMDKFSLGEIRSLSWIYLKNYNVLVFRKFILRSIKVLLKK